MSQRIFTIMSMLTGERAVEVARQMAGAIDEIDGAAFAWAKRVDEAGDGRALCPQVLSLLHEVELRSVALRWHIDLTGNTSRREIIASLFAAMDAGGSPGGQGRPVLPQS